MSSPVKIDKNMDMEKYESRETNPIVLKIGMVVRYPNNGYLISGDAKIYQILEQIPIQ